MKRMLYSIHIPWGWIKQRPQFIAEELSKYFEVTVLEKKIQNPVVKSKLPTKRAANLKFKLFNTVPLYNPLKKKNILFNLINKICIDLSVRFDSYKYIWISSIKYFALLKGHISKNQIVIYDCMDDELAFPLIASDASLVNNASLYEIELLNRADYIICSSDNLKQVILNRTGVHKDVLVVNNATMYPDFNSDILQYNIEFNPNCKSITYIGTISKWFDFDSIRLLLEKNLDVELYLFGPIDCNVPSHSRIHVMGSCEHKYIWSIMLQSDILIMPFQINPLILSVNPVKLYEYIWSRKPVISIEYPEALKFSDFVYYYSDGESLNKIYQLIKTNHFKPKCQDISKIANFLKNNSWESRVESIMAYIES